MTPTHDAVPDDVRALAHALIAAVRSSPQPDRVRDAQYALAQALNRATRPSPIAADAPADPDGTRAKLNRLREMSAKASRGEWWTDSMEADGATGTYKTFAIHADGGVPIMDALNSHVASLMVEHDEDGGSEWDEQGRADSEFAAECVNYVRAALSASEGVDAAALREAIRERDEARQIVRDIHWMAKRYADGRMSYAVGQFNDAVRKGFDAGWLEWKMENQEPRYARDGMFSAEWKTIEQRLRDAEAEAACLRVELEAVKAGGTAPVKPT